MRRGCISLGEIKCDLCENVIPNAKRYMAEEEKDKSGKSQTKRYCIDCCVKKGYAEYREEKGEKILTVFPEKEANKK